MWAVDWADAINLSRMRHLGILGCATYVLKHPHSAEGCIWAQTDSVTAIAVTCLAVDYGRGFSESMLEFGPGYFVVPVERHDKASRESVTLSLNGWNAIEFSERLQDQLPNHEREDSQCDYRNQACMHGLSYMAGM